MRTSFDKVYNFFFSKITDDMYMELDLEQTKALVQDLLINAIPWFEFPRVNINEYDLEEKYFNVKLTNEEMNILATYMVVGWLDQQLASIEMTRMKFSGSDFKFTSQANHMAKLLALKKDYEKTGFHLQRLYKRRKADQNGVLRSTMGFIMRSSVKEGVVRSSPQGSSTTTYPDEWESMDDSNFPLSTGDEFEPMINNESKV